MLTTSKTSLPKVTSSHQAASSPEATSSYQAASSPKVTSSYQAASSPEATSLYQAASSYTTSMLSSLTPEATSYLYYWRVDGRSSHSHPPTASSCNHHSCSAFFFTVTFMCNIQLYEVSLVTKLSVSLYICDCSLQQL